MSAQFVFTPHSLTYFLRLPNVSGTAEREFKRKTFQNWEYEISTALLLLQQSSKTKPPLSHQVSTGRLILWGSAACYGASIPTLIKRTIGYCFSTYASNIEDCLCQTKDSLCAVLQPANPLIPFRLLSVLFMQKRDNHYSENRFDHWLWLMTMRTVHWWAAKCYRVFLDQFLRMFFYSSPRLQPWWIYKVRYSVCCMKTF